MTLIKLNLCRLLLEYWFNEMIEIRNCVLREDLDMKYY